MNRYFSEEIQSMNQSVLTREIHDIYIIYDLSTERMSSVKTSITNTGNSVGKWNLDVRNTRAAI